MCYCAGVVTGRGTAQDEQAGERPRRPGGRGELRWESGHKPFLSSALLCPLVSRGERKMRRYSLRRFLQRRFANTDTSAFGVNELSLLGWELLVKVGDRRRVEEVPQFVGERGGEANGLFLEVGAGVFGGGFEEEFAGGAEDAVGEGEADAAEIGEPEFNGEAVVVTGGRAVAELTGDDGEDQAGLLNVLQRFAQGAAELAAGGFKQVEVARVINVIADGAFGVGDAVVVVENLGGHGGCERDGRSC